MHVPVNDIDLEMGVEDAYRFQELFAAHALQPVSLVESDAYRSHFGRFNVRTGSVQRTEAVRHGIVIEVMGDLQRREGGRWAPTATSTEATVDVEGVPVRVSWLEEETLAYIRRGRLERAAQCLPHCDRDRLIKLLKGERATSVL